MDDIELNATLKEKVSKNNKKYYVVEIQISDNVTKQVFLDPAEVELIRLVYND